MNILALVHGRVVTALQALARDGAVPELDAAGIEVAPARDPAHGDLVCNAALVLAREAAMPPRTLAALLAGQLRSTGDTLSVEVAGAGFLNLQFAPSFWHGVVAVILKAGRDYGRSDAGRGQRIDLACIRGGTLADLDLGRGRAALVTDARARLLAFTGYDVRRVAGPRGGSTGIRADAVSQQVRLLRAGVPARLSAGVAAPLPVTLREVAGEVGADAVRFAMLCQQPSQPIDLDLARLVEPCSDNPVFHVQYAHARAKSLLRNAVGIFPELREGKAAVTGSELALLSDPGEITLIKQLAAFPPLIAAAARVREPHRVALYLHDLASCFHSQVRRGNDLPHLRFIQAGDGTLTAARLALAQANAHVLAAGLKLLGVLAPTEMQ
ncbi:MAG TPA: DALR anticodon-binding domain-containing protein [Hyphomicrobiaceae bacterium]|nr:DALR anticodon-binding domain-containing protein [Hyphomicrobiaceae bacterium]